MSKKEGYSRKGLFGEIKHYDANGRKVGESRPNILGGYSNYDTNGHKTGESRPGIFGGMNHYDSHGHKTGSTRPGILGGANHYDDKGHSPSAGRAEKDIAEGYKDNAEFLSIKYPKTADVFFKMSQSYVYDSDLERRRAENGYF